MCANIFRRGLQVQPSGEACLHNVINGGYAVPVVCFVYCGMVLPVLEAFSGVESGIIFANDHQALNGGRFQRGAIGTVEDHRVDPPVRQRQGHHAADLIAQHFQ